jgi:hypothetical protein
MLLAVQACLDTFLHLFVVVLGAFFSAQLANISASQANRGDHLALAAYQISRQATELMTVERQCGGSVMLLVAVLDLLETMVKRLIAHIRALAAGLQTVAMQLVVVVLVVMMVVMVFLGLCYS